jgi:HEAT repeat protein
VAVTLALLATRRTTDEPSYQDKRLSEWVSLLKDNNSDSFDVTGNQIQLAIQSMGTNALPYLLECISYEPPRWRREIRKRLPDEFADNGKVQGLVDGQAHDRARAAVLAFAMLGTNASPAIPELVSLMQDTNTPYRAVLAMVALGEIGDAGFPALTNALSNPRQIRRVVIIHVIGSQIDTNLSMPTLLAALSDNEPSVRRAATIVLQRIAPEALTNAPPQ